MCCRNSDSAALPFGAHQSASLLVTGSLPPFQEIRSIAVGEGRFYNWEDQQSGRRVAVLGSDSKKQLFGSRNAPWAKQSISAIFLIP